MAMPERGEEVLTIETLITALRKVGEANQVLPGDRHHFRSQISGSNCDLEHFIKKR